jgi:hypothetical protein
VATQEQNSGAVNLAEYCLAPAAICFDAGAYGLSPDAAGRADPHHARWRGAPCPGGELRAGGRP